VINVHNKSMLVNSVALRKQLSFQARLDAIQRFDHWSFVLNLKN